jgi:hypothetical protein
VELRHPAHRAHHQGPRALPRWEEVTSRLTGTHRAVVLLHGIGAGLGVDVCCVYWIRLF